jgi:hypothetical protein
MAIKALFMRRLLSLRSVLAEKRSAELLVFLFGPTVLGRSAAHLTKIGIALTFDASFLLP